MCLIETMFIEYITIRYPSNAMPPTSTAARHISNVRLNSLNSYGLLASSILESEFGKIAASNFQLRTRT